MTSDEQMKFYTIAGPLHWQPIKHGNADGLITEAYEGKYLIVPSGQLLSLHRKSNTDREWRRIAEGRTIEEVKFVAEVEAEQCLASRKKHYPEYFVKKGGPSEYFVKGGPKTKGRK